MAVKADEWRRRSLKVMGQAKPQLALVRELFNEGRDLDFQEEGEILLHHSTVWAFGQLQDAIFFTSPVLLTVVDICRYAPGFFIAGGGAARVHSCVDNRPGLAADSVGILRWVHASKL